MPETESHEVEVARLRAHYRTRRRFINASVRLWYWDHTWEPSYINGFGVDEALWALNVGNASDFEGDEMASAMRSEAEVLP